MFSCIEVFVKRNLELWRQYAELIARENGCEFVFFSGLVSVDEKGRSWVDNNGMELWIDSTNDTLVLFGVKTKEAAMVFKLKFGEHLI